MNFPIYLDNNSTTPVDPEVLESMMPYLTNKFGNAASKSHRFGWEAEESVELNRKKIAQLINAEPKEIVFTSGATEANNLALKGVVERYAMKGNHIITSPAEHKAILDPCRYLQKRGIEITYLKVDEFGAIDPEDLRKAINEKTVLVSLMIANNEIGTINKIKEIGEICKEHEVLFHTDGAQAIGKIPVDVNDLKTDMMSLSAHKIYGPKGIGALYIKSKNPRVKLTEQINGGGHEKSLRSGTLNVPGIVGFGKACEICSNVMDIESKKLIEYRDKMIKAFLENIDYCYLNGHPKRRIPNNLNISFRFIDSDALMMELRELAVSSGSACTSATLESSYVIKATGKNEEYARSSIRFGIGRFNTSEEIDYAIDRIINTVKKLRDYAPAYELFLEDKKKSKRSL
jgi:cysteine desulfurase